MKGLFRMMGALALAGVLLTTGAAPAAAKKITIGIMPKLVGIDFYNAVEKGAREAGKELGVEIVYDGPVTGDVTKQSAILETWIARKFASM